MEKITRIIKPSEHRRESRLQGISKCGGCNLRHMDYNYTLALKKANVENCLYKSIKQEKLK